MIKTKTKIGATLVLAFLVNGMYSQETVDASGGNTLGVGGSVSYSIGQVVYTTNTGTTGSIAQGVQQAYEIYLVTGVQEAKGISLNCKAFPNPTTDLLMLNLENNKLENLMFQLVDMNGKVLENKKIETNESVISMSHLASATYFLKITQNNQEVKTFKIIKN